MDRDNKSNNGIGGPRPPPTAEKHAIFPPHRRSTPLSPVQSHIIAAVAEFVGTFMFLFLAFVGQLMAVSRQPSAGDFSGNSNVTVLIISLAYAISLLGNVWAFYRISGGLFNPAVCISRCRKWKWRSRHASTDNLNHR